MKIHKKTQRFLKWKTLSYLLKNDKEKMLLKHFFKHPIKYGCNFLRSAIRTKSHIRDGDLFLYGVNSVEEFQDLLKGENKILLVGFGYCQKPMQCPAGRFTAQCLCDDDNPTCQNCFIGKCMKLNPNIKPIVITTAYYIGEQIFKLIEENPNKEILFAISACELALKMFGDWGNMVQLKGIGIKLDGRVCTSMQAFIAAENGIKPFQTTIPPEQEKLFLRIINS